MTIVDWIICFIVTSIWFFDQRVWTAILFGTFSEIRNPFTRDSSFAASALMQIRCVNSSEIPPRIRCSPNEKSWMKNPFKRQSQSSPCHQALPSARAESRSGFKFAQMSSLKLRPVEGFIWEDRRFLPSHQQPRTGISRSLLFRDLPISGRILSRRDCAKLQRHSYLPERDE